MLVTPGSDHNTVKGDVGWPLGGPTGKVPSDFLDMHGYAVLFSAVKGDGFTDALTADVVAYYLAFARAFGPVMLQEFGTLVTHGAAQQETFLRTLLWQAWQQGANGFLYWCMRDIKEHTAVPYNTHGLETMLGLFDADDNLKPGLAYFAQFASDIQAAARVPAPPANGTGTAVYIPWYYYSRDDPGNPGNTPADLSPRLAMSFHLLLRADNSARNTTLHMVRGTHNGTRLSATPATLVVPAMQLVEAEVATLRALVAQGATLAVYGYNPAAISPALASLLGVQLPSEAGGSPAQAAIEVAFQGQHWTLSHIPGGKAANVSAAANATVTLRSSDGLAVGVWHRVGNGKVISVLADVASSALDVMGEPEKRRRWQLWFDQEALRKLGAAGTGGQKGVAPAGLRSRAAAAVAAQAGLRGRAAAFVGKRAAIYTQDACVGKGVTVEVCHAGRRG